MSKTAQKKYDETKAPFSWDKLDGLLAYKSSLVTCAEILDCHENSIKNHIKERYGLTFTEYADKKLSKTKVKLINHALKMAYNGNATMTIFCLKNLCSWSDNPDIEQSQLEDLEFI